MALAEPDLLERRFRWHNRWQDWRARRAELLLSALALLVLAGLLLWAAQLPLRLLVNLPWQASHVWIALIGLLALGGLGLHAHGVRERERITHGWLGATPWSARRRQRALRHSLWSWLLQRLLLLAVLLLGLLALRQSFWPAGTGWLLLGAVSAGLLGVPLVSAWLWRQTAIPAPAARGADRRAVRAPSTHLHGLDLLHAGWTPTPPRTWRLSLTLALLSLPTGLNFSGGVVALLVIAAIFVMARNYARYRAICVASAAWLRALPLAPQRLRRHLIWPVLRQQLLLLAGLAGGALLGGGLPWLLVVLLAGSWLMTLCLLMLLAFQLRHQPRRYGMSAMLQLIALSLAAQAFWPLALVVWVVLLVRALRPGPE